MIGIYGIHNTATDDWYIGQSLDIGARWSAHKYQLRSGRHFNPLLQRDFSKFGEAQFEFVVILETLEPELDAQERIAIELYASRACGYNLLEGGCLTHKHSPKSIEKMRIAKLGKPCPDSAREKLSRAHAGRKFSAETRMLMSKAQKERFARDGVSALTRAKQGVARRGGTASRETRLKMSESGKLKWVRLRQEKALQKQAKSGMVTDNFEKESP